MTGSDRIDARLRRGRSVLVTPAHDEQALAAALDSAADFAVADLEDTVPRAHKPGARAVAAELLARDGGERVRMLRVNADELDQDVPLAARLGVDAIVLPKATPQLVATRQWPLPVLAIVESAAGLRGAYELARHEAVFALLLGSADLSSQLGLIARADGRELAYARGKLVVDSAAAGVRPPFDGVFRDVADERGLLETAALVRSMGMGGKTCLQPVQAAAINDAFTPSEAELAWAARIDAAARTAETDGLPMARLDGAIVDEPLILRARTLLAQAGAR